LSLKLDKLVYTLVSARLDIFWYTLSSSRLDILGYSVTEKTVVPSNIDTDPSFSVYGTNWNK
jgi:hypothetical protein